jgi:hypothetical protein
VLACFRPILPIVFSFQVSTLAEGGDENEIGWGITSRYLSCSSSLFKLYAKDEFYDSSQEPYPSTTYLFIVFVLFP